MGEIAVVAVVGAGVLGRDIAQATALAGYRTILEDLLPSSLRKSERQFRETLETSLASGLLSSQAAQSALARLEYADSVEEAARQADVVIEAVPEELESKREIFILLDKICRPGTILVSTSVDTDVTQLASVTYRSEQCVGLRFLRNAQTARWVEVVPGERTSQETLSAIRALAGNVVSLPLNGIFPTH